MSLSFSLPVWKVEGDGDPMPVVRSRIAFWEDGEQLGPFTGLRSIRLGLSTVLLLRFGTLDLHTGIAANGFAPS
jgi:hypothetical protein